MSTFLVDECNFVVDGKACKNKLGLPKLNH